MSMSIPKAPKALQKDQAGGSSSAARKILERLKARRAQSSGHGQARARTNIEDDGERQEQGPEEPETKPKPKPLEIKPPSVLIDRSRRPAILFNRGNFIGKGGFATVYRVKNTKTCKPFALKVIDKNLHNSKKTKRIQEKVMREIKAHKIMCHVNIIKFYHNFEDPQFFYLILELAPKRTLLEVSRARGVLTEPEVRYYFRQISAGARYIHQQGILHRDLKLANMLLSQDMTVKIGDFGLSITLDENTTQKASICGTPNYVSPEILELRGHSVASEIWSIGCIVFALLCGSPPFHSESLSRTYSLIRNVEFTIPPDLSMQADQFIRKMLDKDPQSRGSLEEAGPDSLLDHSFISNGFTPTSLPTSAVSETPLWAQSTVDISMEDSVSHTESFVNQVSKRLNSFLALEDDSHGSVSDAARGHRKEVPVFISRWVDYSNKMGFVCQLSDGNVVVLYNDSTKLGVAPGGKCVEFVDSEGKIISSWDPDENQNFQLSRDLQVRCQELDELFQYMEKTLSATVISGSMTRVVTGQSTLIPQIKRWVRKEDLVIMELSCDLVQINFLVEHVKVILWAQQEGDLRVTVITSESRESRAQTLSLLSDRAEDLTVSVRQLLRRAEAEVSGLSQGNQGLQ